MSDDEYAAGSHHPLRRCSDKECNEARTQWVADTLWPKIRIQMAVQIGATVIFCAGVFLYLSQNSIIAHSLQDSRTYVSAAEHEKTITRIEMRITRMEDAITEAMTAVAAKLDRNMQKIEDLKR